MKNFKEGLGKNIIIIVLGLLVVGVGLYLLKGLGSGDLGKKEFSYFSNRAVDMFEKGRPLVCSSEVNDLEGSIKAVYYFDNQNKKVRTDMEILNKSDGLTISTSSIIKDGWNYFWDDVMNKDGMKVKFDEETDSFLPQDSLNEFSDQEFDFICKDWRVDPSKFELPKDKSFKDLSGITEGLEFLPDTSFDSGLGDGSLPFQLDDNLCEICNFLPDGPEKIECLQSCLPG